MTRLLVTGADGVLAAAVVPRLHRDAQLEICTTSRRDGDPARHRPADLTRPDQVAGLVRWAAPDVVLHLAGGTTGNEPSLLQRNVLTGVRLADALVEADLDAHVVLIGSAAEFGAASGSALGEKDRVQPVSPYGRAKLAQSGLVGGLLERHGLGWTSARLFNVLAPGTPRSSPLGNFRAQLLAGEDGQATVRCGRVDIARDLVRVEDVADALLALVHRRPQGVVNVCSGVGHTYDSLIRAGAAHLGMDVTFDIDPDLAALPAPTRVVGDPSRLHSLGASCTGDLASLVASWLSVDVVTI